MTVYLMSQDIPVMRINSGIHVLEYELLPPFLRHPAVSLEDYYGLWLTGRPLPLDRENAKRLLGTLRLSQNNPVAICQVCRALTLTDCYWLKEEGETVTWADVNLYQNDFLTVIGRLAFSGSINRSAADPPDLTWLQEFSCRRKVVTPELTTHGVTAKAWERDGQGIWLCKVGKKEVAAHQILDALGVSHVRYEEVDLDREDPAEMELISEDRREWLRAVGESLVRCPIISSPEQALISFEEYRLYCERNGKNPYEEILSLDRKHYLEMQVADYLINNIDRHEGNWGLYMDTSTGVFSGLYPLMDHDHAFDRILLPSQTTEQPMAMQTAAIWAQRELQLPVERILRMSKPASLEEEAWDKVLERTRELINNC